MGGGAPKPIDPFDVNRISDNMSLPEISMAAKYIQALLKNVEFMASYLQNHAAALQTASNQNLKTQGKNKAVPQPIKGDTMFQTIYKHFDEQRATFDQLYKVLNAQLTVVQPQLKDMKGLMEQIIKKGDTVKSNYDKAVKAQKSAKDDASVSAAKTQMELTESAQKQFVTESVITCKNKLTLLNKFVADITALDANYLSSYGKPQQLAPTILQQSVPMTTINPVGTQIVSNPPNQSVVADDVALIPAQ